MLDYSDKQLKSKRQAKTDVTKPEGHDFADYDSFGVLTQNIIAIAFSHNIFMKA